MSVRVSVVVPFFDAAATLPACLAALAAQSQARDEYELILVDDGSTDGGGHAVEPGGARLIRQSHRGAAAARNAGIEAARAPWVAFTDADCVPSRGWLRALLHAVSTEAGDSAALGAAGTTVGYQSRTPAARYVDLTGGLDAERHLAHERFPFAPSANVMYRRDALEKVGGFDARFHTYEGCDLHTRLRESVGGAFVFAPRAVVLHRHRDTWKGYWKQQRSYGRGLGQFYLRYRDRIGWTPWREMAAWLDLATVALAAGRPGEGDEALARRGTLVKALAQRIGFVECYWSRTERTRW
jgi:glycosyltransferase involved in cell wall biosynthesis